MGTRIKIIVTRPMPADATIVATSGCLAMSQLLFRSLTSSHDCSQTLSTTNITLGAHQARNAHATRKLPGDMERRSSRRCTQPPSPSERITLVARKPRIGERSTLPHLRSYCPAETLSFSVLFKRRTSSLEPFPRQSRPSVGTSSSISTASTARRAVSCVVTTNLLLPC